MSDNASTIMNIDLGHVQPTSVPMETIEVVISKEHLFSDFGAAFIQEGFRKNPLRMEQINLSTEEMCKYIEYLLAKRIECVSGNCPDYRRLKVLYIPSWIQFNLSMIGEVIKRDFGLRFVPVLDPSITPISYEEAIAISTKIGMLQDDLQIVQDGMPRSVAGNEDVMATACIAGYVRSTHRVEHPISTYASAFMGMKLKQEAAMSVLYRVQYDDLNFIATALMSERGLY